MIKFITKPSLTSLSNEEKERLKQRTFKGRSYMRAVLIGMFRPKIRTIVIAQDTDAKGNNYIGWGFIEKGFRGSKQKGDRDNYISLFVAPHKRRKGIGTDMVKALLRSAKLKSVQVQSQPHNPQSIEFYSSLDMTPRKVK